jgi:plastocyanin
MKVRTTLALFALVLLAAFAFSGCGAKTVKKTTPKALPKKNITVVIKDFAFNPETITIGKESRVTWVNKDAGTHSVDAGEFSSGPLGQGENYSYQFMNVGTYPYRCSFHPYMEGTIIVK